jgi:hypothetical protein
MSFSIAKRWCYVRAELRWPEVDNTNFWITSFSDGFWNTFRGFASEYMKVPIPRRHAPTGLLKIPA